MVRKPCSPATHSAGATGVRLLEVRGSGQTSCRLDNCVRGSSPLGW